MNLKSESVKISKPKQARSRKTMENILDTAQQMLIDRTFDKSSIQEIVKKANSSVGSFYSLSDHVRDKILQIVDHASSSKAMVIYDPNIRSPHKHEMHDKRKMVLENLSFSRIVRGSREKHGGQEQGF